MKHKNSSILKKLVVFQEKASSLTQGGQKLGVPEADGKTYYRNNK